MKLVTAVIKPFKLDDVREALSTIGVQGITVSEVKGFGRQKGHTELVSRRGICGRFSAQGQNRSRHRRWHGRSGHRGTILKAAQTGKIGDGKIFVSSLEQVTRIRTGETGEEAL